MAFSNEVKIMVVARPTRGEEGMGAAAVGPGHRATTYTGVRRPEQPKGRVYAESATGSAHRNFSRCERGLHSVRCTRCFPPS